MQKRSLWFSVILVKHNSNWSAVQAIKTCVKKKWGHLQHTFLIPAHVLMEVKLIFKRFFNPERKHGGKLSLQHWNWPSVIFVDENLYRLHTSTTKKIHVSVTMIESWCTCNCFGLTSEGALWLITNTPPWFEYLDRGKKTNFKGPVCKSWPGFFLFTVGSGKNTSLSGGSASQRFHVGCEGLSQTVAILGLQHF